LVISPEAPSASFGPIEEDPLGLGWLDIVRPDCLSRETVGGHLEIFLAATKGGEGYEVRLGSRVVLKSSYELMWARKRGALEPWFVGSLGSVAPFDEVVLVGWSSPGNACSGSGFTFVGIQRDGAFSIADMPYCGGPEPIFNVTPTAVTVVIPEHHPNRGEGRLPAATWVYADGRVSTAQSR
jgi:hypothetical protein